MSSELFTTEKTVKIANERVVDELIRLKGIKMDREIRSVSTAVNKLNTEVEYKGRGDSLIIYSERARQYYMIYENLERLIEYIKPNFGIVNDEINLREIFTIEKTVKIANKRVVDELIRLKGIKIETEIRSVSSAVEILNRNMEYKGRGDCLIIYSDRAKQYYMVYENSERLLEYIKPYFGIVNSEINLLSIESSRELLDSVRSGRITETPSIYLPLLINDNLRELIEEYMIVEKIYRTAIFLDFDLTITENHTRGDPLRYAPFTNKKLENESLMKLFKYSGLSSVFIVTRGNMNKVRTYLETKYNMLPEELKRQENLVMPRIIGASTDEEISDVLRIPRLSLIERVYERDGDKLWSILKKDIIKIIASKYNYNIFMDDTVINMIESLNLIYNDKIHIVPIVAKEGDVNINFMMLNRQYYSEFIEQSKIQYLIASNIKPTLEMFKLEVLPTYEFETIEREPEITDPESLKLLSAVESAVPQNPDGIEAKIVPGSGEIASTGYVPGFSVEPSSSSSASASASASSSVRNKYLKYKNKYLELKKEYERKKLKKIIV